MIKNKTTLIIITTMFLLILTPNLTQAQNTITPINPQNTQTINPIQLQDFYILEETKTRNELKQHTNQKVDELVIKVKTDGQRIIDENFQVLDKRLHDLAQQFLIKFVIALCATIIFANAIWFFIKNKITNIGKDQNNLTPDEYTKYVAGIINQEYMNQLYEANKKVDHTTKPTYTEKVDAPKIPSVEEINQMLKKQKNTKEEKKQQKLETKKQKYEQKMQKRLQKITGQQN